MLSPDLRPEISILIVSWNTCALTEACLETLPQSVDHGTTYETIVADNGSTDGSLDMLRARDDIALIENSANLGYAAAVNQAFARARGSLILLLNSDIELKPGSLAALVAFISERPEVAGVGPQYLNPDGSLQQHHFQLPTFRMLLAGHSALLRRLPGPAAATRRYAMADEDFSRPRRVEQPSASVLLLRRNALPADRLLDERFPIFFNDVELAHRLANAGRQLWMTPESEVFHVHGASTKLLGGSLVRHHLGSQVRYLELTEPRGRLALFRAVVFTLKLGALVLRRPGALPVVELLAALRGDTGAVPQAPRN